MANEQHSAEEQAGRDARAPFLAMSMLMLVAVIDFGPSVCAQALERTILAGDELALPADSPARRQDTLEAASPFSAVGALRIDSAGFSYIGSATAIGPNWVLTAGHNLDLNDNGAPDPGISISFHLPGFGIYQARNCYTYPGYSGFGNPSIQRDLGLLYFETPLPSGILFPSLSSHLSIGQEAALVGYGRSGYGNYGHTTSASLTDRRIGNNVVDWFTPDDQGGGFPALFRYDFDAPDTTGSLSGSLGNNLESLIGPGDSGGPLLVDLGGSYAIAGVNTFVEGYGGRFGDIGGGVVLAPYLDWIVQMTGIPVPEPSSVSLVLIGLGWLFHRKSKSIKL